jgi:hypothetical protein
VELALESSSDHIPSIPDRVVRKVLAHSLRSLGIPRADPIVTAVVHGAELRLRNSHSLPALSECFRIMTLDCRHLWLGCIPRPEVLFVFLMSAQTSEIRPELYLPQSAPATYNLYA